MRYLRERIDFALMGRSLWTLQASVCPNLAARFRLVLVYSLLVLGAISGRARRTRRVRIRAAGRVRDWWVADPMEVAALSEVFVAGEYGDWLPVEPPRLILDAGANIGSATLWFRERFPEARIIALEPNPQAFERLKRNMGDDPNVDFVNAALAASDGSALFGGEPMTPVGRLRDQEGPGVVEVETLTLETVRNRFAAGSTIDMFKLDVEGAEWQVLASPLTDVGTMAIEIHEPVPAGRDPDELLREVAEREGFELRHGLSSTTAPEKLRWLVRPALTAPVGSP